MDITQAFIGGILIGTAAVLLLWLNGRIAGVSGTLGNLMFGRDRLPPMLFITGIVCGAAFFYGLGGAIPVAREHFSPWLLGLAGLLVGFGTGIGKGCTSGHGVCGLGRLSLRSLVATLTFLTVAMLTTFLVRHVFGSAL
jgi:uncharacterized protein